MFKRIRVKEHIFNKQLGYDYETDTIVNDIYKIFLCENKKHLTKLILNEENLLKKCVVSTTHKSIGFDLFKSYVCLMFDDDLEVKEEYSNEVISYLCSNGLFVFDCNNPQNSILSKDLFINQYSKYDTSKTDTDMIDNLNYSYNNNTQVKLETDSKFNKIVSKYNIELKRDKVNDNEDYKTIQDLKQEYLEDYENQVINLYKITKEIRSPTITAGVSKNKRYFHRQFHYCLSQSVICEENLQMWFRERRTIDKVVYFCFNENTQHYKSLYTKEFIGKVMNGVINISNDKKSVVNKIDYELIDSNDTLLIDLLKVNETNSINCKKSFSQVFFNLLFKHSFRLERNIFLLKDTEKSIDIGEEEEDEEDCESVVNENKQNRTNTELVNFVNTPILDITGGDIKEIERLINEQLPISLYWRQKYNKYRALNYYTKINPLIIVFWIKENITDYISNLQKSKLDCSELLSVLSNETIEKIVRYYENQYNNMIDTGDFIQQYQLHKKRAEFGSKYKQIKDIIKITNEIEEVEEVVKQQQYQKDNKLHKTKILNTLLQFLKVDIKDLDKQIIKRYVIDNDYKKNKITGFRNEILSNDNKLLIDNEEICFIDWINSVLLIHYNNNYNESNKPIYKKKLDCIKDTKIILDIIKKYLLKINIVFDYENQVSNQSKITTKKSNLQIVLRQDTDNIISVNQLSIMKDLNTIFGEYHYDTQKRVLIDTNRVDYLYDKNINLFEKRDKLYYDNIKTEYYPVDTNTNTNINKEPITLYRKSEDCIINGNITIVNDSCIKRKNSDRQYYHNETQLKSELYMCFDNQKKVRRFYSDIDNDKRSFISNRIKRQQDIELKEVLVSEGLDLALKDIKKNNIDSETNNNIKRQLDIIGRSEYSEIEDNKHKIQQRIPNVDYNYTEEELDYDTNYKRKNIILEELVNNVRIPKPTINLNERDYMYNVFNELYKHRTNKELDREIFDCGFYKKIELDFSDCEIDSSSEEEDSDSDSE
jgi:hypothetical protein